MSDLRITLTREFQPDHLWCDRGSGAKMDVTFWRAVPPAGYYLLGDYAQGNYGPPVGTLVVVREEGSGGTAALAAPLGFTRMYCDRKTGSGENGAIWMPIAPTGYVAVGAVTTREYDPPPTEPFRCIRFDFVRQGKVGNLIWNDRSSGGAEDVSVYAIVGNGEDIATGTYYVQPNYQPPTGPAYCLRAATIRV